MPLKVVDSAWRDWYRAVHSERFVTLTGTQFEDYVTSALQIVHGPTFLNPKPKGRLGDHGCDGITGDGLIAYACFGYMSGRASEKQICDKITGDFERAKSQWSTFKKWRFVSNAGVGPKASKEILSINAKHAAGSARQIEAAQVDEAGFWNQMLLPLEREDLDKIFPGVPHSSNVTLSELYPLLDGLGSGALTPTNGAYIGEISPHKMQYNELSQRVRIEFQDARVHVPVIREWFAGHSDPTLRDVQGARFKQIYCDARKISTSPDEIIERLYVNLGGPNFRYESKRANGVYAVTAFFFDECDIFEIPPAGWSAIE